MYYFICWKWFNKYYNVKVWLHCFLIWLEIALHYINILIKITSKQFGPSFFANLHNIKTCITFDSAGSFDGVFSILFLSSFLHWKQEKLKTIEDWVDL